MQKTVAKSMFILLNKKEDDCKCKKRENAELVSGVGEIFMATQKKILLCKSKLTLMTLSKQLLVLPQKCLVCMRVIKITFATFLKIGFTTKLY